MSKPAAGKKRLAKSADKAKDSTKRKRKVGQSTSLSEYWRQRVQRSPHGMCYFVHQIPADPLPHGFFLVHNQGAFCEDGLFGSRSWVQASRSNLVRCYCDFGGTLSVGGKPVKEADIPKHYRIRLEKPG
jgi:hypothetical protein